MNKRERLDPPAASELKVLVSVEEAAHLLSVGRTMVYHLVTCGEIRSVKIGRMRRVVAASLHEYVQRLLTAAA